MTRKERLLALLATVVLIGLVKVGQESYQWWAYTPEREMIIRLEGELESAAIGVVRTQVESDSLRRAIEAMDAELRDERALLDLRERGALDRQSRGSLSGYYRALEEYNRRVRGRNEMFGRWRASLEENRAFVDEYNLVADSIRTLADRMGEPYYPIRTPAEIAVSRGWGAPDG